jgi:hypothetical protein
MMNTVPTSWHVADADADADSDDDADCNHQPKMVWRCILDVVGTWITPSQQETKKKMELHRQNVRIVQFLDFCYSRSSKNRQQFQK